MRVRAGYLGQRQTDKHVQKNHHDVAKDVHGAPTDTYADVQVRANTKGRAGDRIRYAQHTSQAEALLQLARGVFDNAGLLA